MPPALMQGVRATRLRDYSYLGILASVTTPHRVVPQGKGQTDGALKPHPAYKAGREVETD